jgi:hypothetical protein
MSANARPSQIVQSIFELQDKSIGIQYIKLVKSPTGPHYIIDVMFFTGLRLTVDLFPGDSSKKLGDELREKVAFYRVSSVDQLSEAISIISDCGQRAMSEHVKQEELEQMNALLMKQLWEEAAFSRILSSAPILRRVEYEDAVRFLAEFYPSEAPPA